MQKIFYLKKIIFLFLDFENRFIYYFFCWKINLFDYFTIK